MSSIPPFFVTVNAERWASVIDIDLALSPYGLLFVLRLCKEFDVWLVRELWHILDNTQYYLSHPEVLIPSRPGEQWSDIEVDLRRRHLSNIMKQWETARVETDLTGLKLFWIGDTVSDSFLPKEVDPNLLYRFETLPCTIDGLVSKEELRLQYDHIFLNCFRDTAALAASLTPYRPIILTRQGSAPEGLYAPDPEPYICSYLRQWGVKCFRVDLHGKLPMLKHYIEPILARTGVWELIWAGLNLAAVHILAPNAIMMSPLKKGCGVFHEDFLSPSIDIGEEQEFDHDQCWEGATAFWYSIG